MNGEQPGWYERGRPYLWLPETQMKTADPPLPVARMEGSRIVLTDGRTLIDGMASWGAAVHGYSHPHIHAAIEAQLRMMTDMVPDGFVHEQALTLAARLAHMLPRYLNQVFFSESGAAAVDVAMAMAAQYWRNRGVSGRTRFVAFNAGVQAQHVLDLPRDDASEARLHSFLETAGGGIAAIIAEPLVQSANGMIFNDEMCLKRLRRAADEHDLILIFDETFTGFARTGAMFASDVGVTPDIVALGNALSGGALPLAATVASQEIFDAFWSDDASHALMHAGAAMGNALACAAANASLDLFESEPRCLQAAEIAKKLTYGLGPCIGIPGVTDVRVRGAIGVVELETIGDVAELTHQFVAAGMCVRPYGNIVALTPALTIDDADLAALTEAVVSVIRSRRA
jgi:adenosylmethionine-8-amino-7-oxononanoate aminotransferase